MEAGNPPIRYGSEESSGKKTLKVIVALVVLAAIGAAVAWVLVGRWTTDHGRDLDPDGDGVGPVVVSNATLSALAANTGHPVYWAGAIAGRKPEFTKTTISRVYVRYLPAGVKAGDPRTDYLIVATYPFPGAYAALKKASDGRAITIPGGGIAVVSRVDPRSVNFAYPNAAFQGEIYDPSAAKALATAKSGDIQPIP